MHYKLAVLKAWNFSTDKENYKMAYLHFDTFYMENKSTENFIKRVMDPNLKAQIIYDDPHYWVVMENKSPQNHCTGTPTYRRFIGVFH